MKKILLKLMLILTLFTTNIIAEDKPQAVIIFDASGSMWGQIDGVNKITIAKEALNRVVSEWNPNVELGLTVYGHRKKGDCSDIETVVPVSTVDKDKIISIVKKIQPKGKTPIARTLQKVAEELKFTEEKATIILISDGKESCNANPCAVAKNLEKKGIDFVTHVIGFNVDKKTDEQLECIADATGGEYFSAKDATALNDAMKIIVKKVEKVEPTPTPKPTPEPTPKKLKKSLEITASEKEGGKWVVSSYNIYKQDDEGKAGKRMTSTTSTSKKEAVSNKIPVGKYIIKSNYNAFQKNISFEIKVGEVTKLNIVFGQTGEVETTASETNGGKWIDTYHYMYKDDEGKRGNGIKNISSTRKKAGKGKLPVGKYFLQSKYNEFEKLTAFEIKAGEVTKLNIVFGQTGEVETTASETNGGKWIDTYHYMYKDDEGKRGNGIKNISSTRKKAGKGKLPVGKYFLQSKYNEFEKLTAFEIKAGEVTKLNIVFGQTGEVETTASETNGGKWIDTYHYMYKDDEGKRGDGINNISSTKKKAGKGKLPVGKYFLQSKHNEFEKLTAFEIKAGEVTKLHIVFEQFRIETKCTDMNANVNYEVYANSGRMVHDAKMICSKALQLSLDAGDYRVEATVGSEKKEKKFTIGKDSKKLIIDMSDMKKEPTK